MDRPETRFAWNGEVSLAYQVCGGGPTDLVYLQGYCSNVDMNWESPYLSRFLRGLASHARLIVTDRRGWGCSERFTPGHVPDVDTLTDDILAVLKAARSERASIMATYDSAIVASLFAGLHTGEVERIGEKIGGLAVNIGARVAALATPSELLVSQTVRDLMVGSDLTFADRGSHELKGVPGVWGLYAARKEGEPRGFAEITAPA